MNQPFSMVFTLRQVVVLLLSLVAVFCSSVEAATVNLARATPVTNLSGVQGSSQLFSFSVPAGARALRIITSGGSGDANLYIRFGQAPTTSLHDCNSGDARANEKCLINNPTAGTWYALIDGYSAYAGVTLLADYDLTNDSRTVTRVLAGAIAPYTDSSGQLWATDASVVSGGQALQEPGTTVINAGRFDPKLFMNQRWGDGGNSGPLYSFPVSNGQYAVNLYFVDTYAPTCAKGARIFDVLVEGKVALSNLDIFDQATGSGNVPGCKRGLVMTVPATVSDGALAISFTRKTQYPRIDAIEILPVAQAGNLAQGKLTTWSSLETPAFPASAAVDGGHIHVNGERAKPSRKLRLNDEIRVRKGAGLEIIVWVRLLAAQRGPASSAAC